MGDLKLNSQDGSLICNFIVAVPGKGCQWVSGGIFQGNVTFSSLLKVLLRKRGPLTPESRSHALNGGRLRLV